MGNTFYIMRDYNRKYQVMVFWLQCDKKFFSRNHYILCKTVLSRLYNAVDLWWHM